MASFSAARGSDLLQRSAGCTQTHRVCEIANTASNQFPDTGRAPGYLTRSVSQDALCIILSFQGCHVKLEAVCKLVTFSKVG
mmetsp:Transcript_5223/g.9209  ORF Transcript_5223/g.9209 Transcript_5223/m.9209 type:complete len:82 (+) Transcript_5223:2836-3081(+)